MFEDYTYESILEGMLQKAVEIYPDLDTREGSVLYTALAPAAVEIVNLYINLDNVLDMSFADTATREYLIRRCSERGIAPKEATCAVVAVSAKPDGVEIPVEMRFSCDGYIYYTTGKKLEDYYLMECETAGSGGNKNGGTLLPLTYVENLTSATIASLQIAGEDEEDTELLRSRYIDSFSTLAFGGNIADYTEKVTSISGVGAVKIYPAYNGAGTVKVVFVGSDNKPPSDALVDIVQETIDPETNQGEGLGLAPIGHVVTVEGAQGVNIDITMTIDYADSYTWDTVENKVLDAIDGYFEELNGTWSASNVLIVRTNQIEWRLIKVVGINGVSDIKLNNVSTMFPLEENEIAVRGNVSG